METRSATPPANIYEAGGELSVAVPIPGAHPNHVEVLVRPQSLRVEATCKYPQERQHYLRRDWQVGAWTLDLALPKPVDPAGSRATLNLGVLVVMAPLSGKGDGAEHRPSVEGSAS
jgi:HSP20 family molecular chaperone IbpA